MARFGSYISIKYQEYWAYMKMMFEHFRIAEHVTAFVDEVFPWLGAKHVLLDEISLCSWKWYPIEFADSEMWIENIFFVFS